MICDPARTAARRAHMSPSAALQRQSVPEGRASISYHWVMSQPAHLRRLAWSLESSVCVALCIAVSAHVSSRAAYPRRLYYTRHYTAAAIHTDQPTGTPIRRTPICHSVPRRRDQRTRLRHHSRDHSEYRSLASVAPD
jgi:hypothetical protein